MPAVWLFAMQKIIPRPRIIAVSRAFLNCLAESFNSYLSINCICTGHVIQFRLPIVYLCVWRLIVWQQVLLLRCFTKRLPGHSYLWEAGILLGNFGSGNVPMTTMDNAMPVPTPALLPSKEDVRKTSDPSPEASVNLPISTKWTLGAIFDAHKWHQYPDRVGGLEKVFFFPVVHFIFLLYGWRM